MSMFNCPECENSVSDKAISCCHCGYPLQQGVQNGQGLTAAWRAVEKSRTPINVFSIAMMSCAAILGVSATWIDAGNSESFDAFVYSLHLFLAISGMFFAAILFCRRGMYHPKDLADAQAAGATDLGKDQPVIAAAIVIVVMLAYGGYHLKINGQFANSCPDLAQQTDTNK